METSHCAEEKHVLRVLFLRLVQSFHVKQLNSADDRPASHRTASRGIMLPLAEWHCPLTSNETGKSGILEAEGPSPWRRGGGKGAVKDDKE